MSIEMKPVLKTGLLVLNRWMELAENRHDVALTHLRPVRMLNDLLTDLLSRVER